MDKVRSVSLFLAGFLAILALSSCASPLANDQKTVTITTVGWVHQNVSPGYWTSNPPTATQYLDLTVVYSGANLGLADFDALRISSPSGATKWSIPITSSNLDLAAKTVDTSLWSSKLSANGSLMETGDYQVQILLKTGESAPFTRSVPPPGSKTSSGPGYTYSEEFKGTKTASHYPSLKRALVVSGEKTSLGVTVKFQSNDSLFFSGKVYFYDAAGASVARSSSFVAYGTGIASANVNSGAGVFNSGATNTVTMTPSQLVYTGSRSYSDIASYVVFLTDGSQYLGSTSTYDSQSWSERITFAPPLEPDGAGWADFRVTDDALLEKTLLYPVAGTHQETFTEASVSFENLSGSPYFGILFCYQNRDNHYRFRAETGGGSYSLEKVVGGEVTTTSSGSMGGINRPGINVLTVKQTSPGVFRIWVNARLVSPTLTDSTFSGGASGYYLSTSWFMPTSGYHTKVQMTLPLTNP